MDSAGVRLVVVEFSAAFNHCAVGLGGKVVVSASGADTPFSASSIIHPACVISHF